MKGSPQSEKDSHCGLSDGHYHESQTPYLNNTPNETGKYDFEGNIPVPARFESEISQSEVVDYACYATIQSEKPPKEKETMALSTEKITRTNTSTTRSPTPQLGTGTPESVRSVYIAQNQGKTALHISVERGNLGIVRFLLFYGIDVNRRDDSGRTALHYAARGPHIEIVAELLATGADLEARDKEGRTPLHAAADVECEPVIRLLVREGADLNATIGISRSSSIEEGEYMPDYQQTIAGE